MAASSYLDAIQNRLKAFRSAERGNVMLTFALSIVPIMGFVGSAIDYSRANAAKASMQSAIDATALMLSKDAASLTTSDFNSKATTYFNALMTNKEVSGVTLTPTYTTTGGSQVVIKATAYMPTTFMKVVGMPTLNLDVSSTVKWGNTRLRVALVLDNTGSMSSAGKLTALKTATTNLLSQLQTAAAKDGDVYVSIVPFVKDVAVDPITNNGASWIDWTDWLAEPQALDTTKSGSKPSTWYTTGAGSSCPLTSSSQGFGCALDATSTSSTTTIASSGNYKGLICPGTDTGAKLSFKNGVMYNGCYNSWTKCVGSACQCTGSSSVCSCTGSGSAKTCTATSGKTEHTWRPTNTNATYTPALVLDSGGAPYATPATSTWNGCITDRGSWSGPDAGNYDTNVTVPSVGNNGTLFPAEQYAYCIQSMMPLNYNWTTMKNLVNGMVANGSTNQNIGLVLGWQSLVGGGPFPTPPAKDSNYQYQEVIILLSDGLNTQDRWYGDGSSTSTKVDDRQILTCNNVKAAKITIYTVQVNTGGDPTSTLLQNCASSSDKFYLLTSANQIITTFTQIGTALSNLRVAK
jgi:Flp pilus assembly protein TadG